MINHLYTKYFVFFIITSLVVSEIFASNTVLVYPKLTMHGETYENSCSPKPKEKLMDDIRKNTAYSKRSLQNAIEFILCGDQNSRNTKRITRLINEVVVISYEGTGEGKITTDSKRNTTVVKTIMARGMAWDATLIFEDSDVKLQYFSNEACVKSVKLRYVKNSWLVHEIGEACD